MNIAQVKALLSYSVACLLLGYVGFQYAGWTGAILLPIVVILAMALLFAPFAVLVVGTGLIIHAIKGFRRVKRRIRGGDESSAITQSSDR